MDLGIHCIDLLRYLCGPVESVAALVETLVDDSPVADTATLLLRMASGAQAVVTSHWTTANYEPERANGVEICGTEGSIIAAPISAKDSAGTLQVFTEEGIRDYSIEPGGPRPHVALLGAFGEAVAGGGPNPIPGEEGLAGLAVVEAAHESARGGQRAAVLDSPTGNLQ